mmetsp:Transcript_20142/g.55505  ORF Transcript_20142/g.55505 Transcript_20142/m.55505 type:complete len:488 (-) Transcript_20142:10-1473(-)
MGCSLGAHGRGGSIEELHGIVEALASEIRELRTQLEGKETSSVQSTSIGTPAQQVMRSGPWAAATLLTDSTDHSQLNLPGEVNLCNDGVQEKLPERGTLGMQLINAATVQPYLQMGTSVKLRHGPPDPTITHFLRQNICTDQWVIIASGLKGKPRSYASNSKSDFTHCRPIYVEKCPFCKGNERMCEKNVEPPILDPAAATSSQGPWVLRVVNNKFPYLKPEGTAELTFSGIHPQITAVGRMEVVIEHELHNMCLALCAPSHVPLVMACLQRRGLAMLRDSRIVYVKYLQNHGARAGGSLHHPHLQVVGLPLVPSKIAQRFQVAKRFHAVSHTCCFCSVIEQEVAEGTRVIAKNALFVAVVPFAANTSHHVWILPLRHNHSFLDATSEELHACGEILQLVLRKMYRGFNDPDYNIAIRSAPVLQGDPGIQSYFHWYLSVVPHLTEDANFKAFEVAISSTTPEAAAAELRSFDDSEITPSLFRDGKPP